jgi:hypothetical protein
MNQNASPYGKPPAHASPLQANYSYHQAEEINQNIQEVHFKDEVSNSYTEK